MPQPRLKPTVPKIIRGAVPDQSLDWPIAWPAVLLVADVEKLTFEPYVCPAGVPTNGWGETDGVHMGMEPWTKEYADKRFVESLTERAAAVRAAVTVPLNANQLGACVSLTYNIGVPAFRTSTVCKRLNDGDFPAAVRAFALWNQITLEDGRKVVSNGLTARRAHEQALFLSPLDDEHHEGSPQEVDGESSLAKSPIAVSGAGVGSVSVLGLLSSLGDKASDANATIDKVSDVSTRATTAVTGVKGFFGEFGVTPIQMFGGAGVVLAAVIVWNRIKQRRQGWS